eukprot:4140591-Prorocentrum_lima.AAC.1
MTSSLVGSEMCIRDRTNTLLDQLARQYLRREIAAINRHRACLRQGIDPCSSTSWEPGSSSSDCEVDPMDPDFDGPSQALMDVEQEENGEEELLETQTWRVSICQTIDVATQTIPPSAFTFTGVGQRISTSSPTLETSNDVAVQTLPPPSTVQ